MGLFRKRTADSGGAADTSAAKPVEGMNEDAQDVIKDNLEVMYDIVMQIREDPEFAKNIYRDCPRLQHMLDERPDLRPVFEDPEMVRINFEQVYRDQGGVLPEDKPKKPSCLSVIVNHPLFKVFKVLLFFKKVMNCVFGGGFAMIKGCFAGLCIDEAAEQIGDRAGDPGGHGGDGGQHEGGHDADGGHEGNPKHAESREALNNAAEYMEDPEVQDQMQELLHNDTEGLQEAIENDPELRELRDSSPFVAELMNDPETMKILTDPDNLRALGEAPDLIEADFVDPDWAPDDIETGGVDSSYYMETQPGGVDNGVSDGVTFGAEGADTFVDGADTDAFDPENPHPEEDVMEDDEGNMADDFELGDTEDGGNQAGGKGKSQQKKQQNQKNSEGGSGGGGFLSQVGAGITDMIAAELVGVTASEMMGGGDDFGVEEVPAEDAANAAADSATAMEDAAMQATAISDAADLMANDDVLDNLDNLEDGMDNMEDTHEERQQESSENRNAERARAGAAGAAGGAIVGGGTSSGKKGVDDEDQEEGEEDEPEKKKRFGFIGNMASKISTAAKEHVATALLGDDFGEMLVEKVEEEDESEEEGDDPESEKDKSKEESDEKSGRKKRNVFRRNR